MNPEQQNMRQWVGAAVSFAGGLAMASSIYWVAKGGYDFTSGLVDASNAASNYQTGGGAEYAQAETIANRHSLEGVAHAAHGTIAFLASWTVNIWGYAIKNKTSQKEVSV